MKSRKFVADWWDSRIAAWIESPQELEADEVYQRWRNSYNGIGNGAVDDQRFPDPYCGDLRGERHEPKFVFLGLNPGPGHQDLHYRNGIYTRRIACEGYSRCYNRGYAGDPLTEETYRGRKSLFWRRLGNFVRSWSRETVSLTEILNFELYPWASNRIRGTIIVPPDIVKRFILDPIAETNTDLVFAFGKPWARVLSDWASKTIVKIITPVEIIDDRISWRISVFGLQSGQRLVVSYQRGYAGPPGCLRISKLRNEISRTDGYSW